MQSITEIPTEITHCNGKQIQNVCNTSQLFYLALSRALSLFLTTLMKSNVNPTTNKFVFSEFKTKTNGINGLVVTNT